jgi:hypothetical protein
MEQFRIPGNDRAPAGENGSSARAAGPGRPFHRVARLLLTANAAAKRPYPAPAGAAAFLYIRAANGLLIRFVSMPAPRVHAFTLTPHPAVPSRAVHAIDGTVTRVPGGLLVHYVLEGEIDRARVPASKPPRFADGLWRHTCCEAFVARRNEPGYVELNFAPSGEWAIYRFRRTRERAPLESGLTMSELDPHVTVCRAAGRLELDAVIQLDRVWPDHSGTDLALGLSAVIEDDGGSLSYWALRHPLDKPDFHHPAAFALELDAVRT